MFYYDNNHFHCLTKQRVLILIGLEANGDKTADQTPFSPTVGTGEKLLNIVPAST